MSVPLQHPTVPELDLPRTVVVSVGRVTRADRGACDVLPAGDAVPGLLRATWGADVVAAAASDPEAVPATGDWVALASWPDDRVTVEVVLPRAACLARAQVAAGSSYRQVLAANVDVVAVVEGMSPDPDPGRLERLLALAWASGATPVVVLTKADLVARPDLLVAEVGELAPGCTVLPVASPTGAGVDDVRALVAGGGTMALLGASGVGKSSLLNALVGAAPMRVRELRTDGKGRHTTVTRELHQLPGGGAVIDTPGLRSVGLAGTEQLQDVFAEVEELAAGCRFGDCAHTVEPGCAVRAAVESGELTARRLDSYRRLQREAEYQASRTDARLRAERASRWRQLHRQARTRSRP